MLQQNIEEGQEWSSLEPATSYTSTSLHEAVRLRMSKDEHDPDYIAPQTIPQFFHDCCKQYACLPALAYESEMKREEKGNVAGTSDCNYSYITYEEYKSKVEQTALMLIHVGLQPHTSVGILAHNCPEWFYVELGAMCAGGVAAGIYTTSSPEAVLHALQTSEATVCVVDDATQLAKVRAVRSHLPRLKSIIQLHGPYERYVVVEQGYYRWTHLMSVQFEEALRSELKRRERNIGANECALLTFTSGTTGMPKAVMISHDAITAPLKAFRHQIGYSVERDITVSYLPLSHIAAQKVDLFATLECGGCVYFAHGDALKGDAMLCTLLQTRPTRFFGVPRVYAKLFERLNEIDSGATSLSRHIMEWAKQTVLSHHLRSAAADSNKMYTTPSYWLAAIVAQQIRSHIGLERCKLAFSGAAPTTFDLLHFFLSLDMPVSNIYGATECSGGISFGDGIQDLHGVGRAYVKNEIKIDKPNPEGHGEICIRGRSVMMGYLNEPAKTAEVLDQDGWFHTGDIGCLNERGNLVITGRLKELIITEGGENIPPVRIEELVKSELPCISNAMLIGDKRKYLTMLLTLKTEVDPHTGIPMDALQADAVAWLQSLGFNYKRLSEVLHTPTYLTNENVIGVEVKPDQGVIDAIQAGLGRVNAKAISRAQYVQKFRFLPHDFSVATGELGSTLKLRRSVIQQKYANTIEEMYTVKKGYSRINYSSMIFSEAVKNR